MRDLLLWSLAGAAGLLITLRGAFPGPERLADRLAQPDPTASEPQTAFSSFWEKIATKAVSSLQRERIADFKANLKITHGVYAAYCVDKLNSAVGVGLILFILAYLKGWASSPVTVVVIFAAGAAIGFLLPDFELKAKADRRREEFREALNAFVSLVAVCITGGGGVNSAIKDALDVGGEWPFVMMRETFDQAALSGESPWVMFDQLGRELKLEDLIELAGSLSLAGASGARVAETLQSRARANDDRERNRTLEQAEKRSERMSIPVALLALSWMGFVGYAALAGLVGRG